MAENWSFGTKIKTQKQFECDDSKNEWDHINDYYFEQKLDSIELNTPLFIVGYCRIVCTQSTIIKIMASQEI